MHDRYRSRFRLTAATNRLRQQIALEAARRLLPSVAPGNDELQSDWLDKPSSNELYAAKRKAAAVLGHRVRPGDLPSDAEVREQLVALWRAGESRATENNLAPDLAEDEAVASLVDHVDRFAIYKMRLLPLETIKQNSKIHPEGDALYHSLQVFELAREARPYDEEFLLAALLHDVGKAIDPQDHVGAAVQALRGAVTDRTLWLIEHHMDLLQSRDRPIPPRLKRELESSEYFEDLKLLRELDDAGRVPGMQVETIDEILAYLLGLETETYLEE
jgi:predicted HD phosphohydrolase